MFGENGSRLAPSKSERDPSPPPKTGAGVIHHTGFAEGDPFAFALEKGVEAEGEANGELEAENAELLVPANAANPPVLATRLNAGVGEGDEVGGGVVKIGVWVGSWGWGCVGVDDLGAGAGSCSCSGAGVGSLTGLGAGEITSRASCLFIIVCGLVYVCPSRMFSSERRIDSRHILRDLAKANLIQTLVEILTKAAIGGLKFESRCIQINSVG